MDTSGSYRKTDRRAAIGWVVGLCVLGLVALAACSGDRQTTSGPATPAPSFVATAQVAPDAPLPTLRDVFTVTEYVTVTVPYTEAVLVPVDRLVSGGVNTLIFTRTLYGVMPDIEPCAVAPGHKTCRGHGNGW